MAKGGEVVELDQTTKEVFDTFNSLRNNNKLKIDNVDKSFPMLWWLRPTDSDL